MGLVTIGPGQHRIDAGGVYRLDFDVTNTTLNTPFIDLVPGVHNIKLILAGRAAGSYGSNSQNIGIRGSNNAALSIISHGFSLRGFRTAIQLVNCYLTQIEGVFIQDAWLSGITHHGSSAVIRNNYIQNIGGQTIDNGRAFGIDVDGPDATIRDNTVRNVFNPVEEAIGISMRDRGERAAIFGNLIKNAAPAPNTSGGLPGSWGVWVGGQPSPATNVDITHNLISGYAVGIGASSPTDGLIDENVITNCNQIMVNNGGLTVGGMDG